MADKQLKSLEFNQNGDKYYPLPLVTSENNGKILKVVNGKWTVSDLTGGGQPIIEPSEREYITLPNLILMTNYFKKFTNYRTGAHFLRDILWENGITPSANARTVTADGTIQKYSNGTVSNGSSIYFFDQINTMYWPDEISRLPHATNGAHVTITSDLTGTEDVLFWDNSEQSSKYTTAKEVVIYWLNHYQIQATAVRDTTTQKIAAFTVPYQGYVYLSVKNSWDNEILSSSKYCSAWESVNLTDGCTARITFGQ